MVKMGEINCPGCNAVISDRAVKCKKCRYPLGKYISPENDDDGVSHLLPEEVLSVKDPELAAAAAGADKRSRGRKKWLAVTLTVIALLVGAAFAVFFLMGGGIMQHTVVQINVGELTMSRVMRVGYQYVVSFSSDESAPFAAVVKEKSPSGNSDGMHYVLMKNGSGTLSMRYSKDNTYYSGSGLSLVGCCEGYEISKEDLNETNIRFVRTGKNAYGRNKNNIIDADISLDPSMSGIMLYSISFYEGSYVLKNLSVPVCEGKGRIAEEISYYYSDWNSSHLELVPEFFIPVKEQSRERITVSSPTTELIEPDADADIRKLYGMEAYADSARRKKEDGCICELKARTEAVSHGGIMLYSYNVKCQGSGDVSGQASNFAADGNFTVDGYVWLSGTPDAKDIAVSVTPWGYIEYTEVS